ncbi:MAG: rhodanese-like domain-containing protein [Patescibacteria group bacterium]|nr:rhodanese-like domain-containing protein [Patescibacteria group bacterium]
MKNTFEVIDRDRLRGWINNKKDFALVDVLSDKSYEDKHLPGARNIPGDTKNFVKEVEKLISDKDGLVVIYCSNFDCQASLKAADKLVKVGFANVYHFKGGLADWSDAGFPFEREGQLVYV